MAERRTLTRMEARAPLLALAALVVTGCTTLDCDDPTRYVGAELHKPVASPPGLDPVQVRDDYRVPGGAPPADFKGGNCLMKPPEVVAIPAAGAVQPQPAPVATPAATPAPDAPVASPPTVPEAKPVETATEPPAEPSAPAPVDTPTPAEGPTATPEPPPTQG